MSQKHEVAIVRCEEYVLERVLASMREAIALIGGLDSLKVLGNRALLKPNMLWGSEPDKAITTHPTVVEACIILFQEAGFNLVIGDSPGIESTVSVAKRNGIMEVAKRYGVPMADFGEGVVFQNPNGKYVKSFTIAKVFAEVDFVVTLPKLKNHTQMVYTGALKNQFGMVPGVLKAAFHVQFTERDSFAQMIVDLNRLIKPELGIMDAVVGMEGEGPSGGEPKKIGLILASRDILALDIVATNIVGYDYRSIPILRLAADAQNDWVSSAEEIETKGERIEDVRVRSFKRLSVVTDVAFARNRMPAFLYKMMRNLLVRRPFFNKKKCILCGKCVKICSAGALSIETDKRAKDNVEIVYDKCIRCYCCHEICPERAIDLKRRL